MDENTMKMLKMAAAAYMIYYMLFKNDVRHNAQATVMEMMQKFGVASGNQNAQRMIILAVILAYLFKDNVPILAKLFSNLGMSGASPLTHFLDKEKAVVQDASSVIEKKQASLKSSPTPMYSQPIGPVPKPESVMPSASPSAASMGPSASASPQGGLMSSFQQPIS